jgi:hypothetical protein
MTRVFLSLSVLDYCEAMADLVREVCEKPAISGVSPRNKRKELSPVRRDLPAFRLAGLLKPPITGYADDETFSSQNENLMIEKILAQL